MLVHQFSGHVITWSLHSHSCQALLTAAKLSTLIFWQICGVCDRELHTARGGDFNPEGAGGSRASGSHRCGAADTEDLPDWRGNEEEQPNTPAKNPVSESEIAHKSTSHTTTTLRKTQKNKPGIHWLFICFAPVNKPSRLCVTLVCLPSFNRESEADSESETSALGSNV